MSFVSCHLIHVHAFDKRYLSLCTCIVSGTESSKMLESAFRVWDVFCKMDIEWNLNENDKTAQIWCQLRSGQCKQYIFFDKWCCNFCSIVTTQRNLYVMLESDSFYGIEKERH